MSALPHPNSVRIGRSETAVSSKAEATTSSKVAWYAPVYWIAGTLATVFGTWAVVLGETSGITSVVAGVLVATLGAALTRKIVERAGKRAES